MNRTPIRVVKVGGSLFDLPDLGWRLANWLKDQPPLVNLLVTGGGVKADRAARFAREHGCSEAFAHWLCIRMMRRTAIALVKRLGTVDGGQPLTWPAAVQMGETGVLAIVLDPEEFLREDDTASSQPLPEDSTVSSDSIAARFAHVFRTEELVLLKSTDGPSPPLDWSNCAAAGLVDAHFPHEAAHLPRVRIVNLRNYTSTRPL